MDRPYSFLGNAPYYAGLSKNLTYSLKARQKPFSPRRRKKVSPIKMFNGIRAEISVGSVPVFTEDMFDSFAPCIRRPYWPYAIPLRIQTFSGFLYQPISFRDQFRAASVIAGNHRDSTGHGFD